MKSISTVLRCAVYFDGLPLFDYSVVQQMLDDSTYMSSVHVHVHMCRSKLSMHPKKVSKSGRVSFRVLVKAINPLHYITEISSCPTFPSSCLHGEVGQ